MDRSLQHSLVKSLVTVYRTDSNSGMGVYVEGDYIITAAHCLPEVPDRDLPGEHVVEVEFGTLCDGSRAKAFVMYADVCGDVAILATRTLKGAGLPHQYAETFHAAKSKLEPALVAIGELPVDENFQVHVYTHEGRWLEGVGEIISPDYPFLDLTMTGDAVIQPGTSGSPVFDDEGGVVGVISMSTDDESGDTDAVWLAAALPRWVLRQLCPHEA